MSLAKLSVVAFKSLINPALLKAYATANGSLVDVTHGDRRLHPAHQDRPLPPLRHGPRRRGERLQPDVVLRTGEHPRHHEGVHPDRQARRRQICRAAPGLIRVGVTASDGSLASASPRGHRNAAHPRAIRNAFVTQLAADAQKSPVCLWSARTGRRPHPPQNPPEAAPAGIASGTISETVIVLTAGGPPLAPRALVPITTRSPSPGSPE